MANIKEAIEFTIKNLDLRIEKAQNSVTWNNFYLDKAKRENNTSDIKIFSDKINHSKNLAKGYDKAEIKLRHNKKLTKKDIDCILKSLNIRLKILNENLKFCKDAVAKNRQALIDKKDQREVIGGFGVVTVHDDKTSLYIIENCERRISNITKSLEKCNTAIEFFSKMK